MPDLLTTQSAITDILDRDEEYLVELTQELVRFKSVNPKFIPPSATSEETQLQEHVADLLNGLGLATETWDALPGRPNVVATMRGSTNGRSMVLNGHIDVVPEGDPAKWHHDPYGASLENGRLYGRGACDMKGGVGAMIAAVRAIREAGVELAGDVQLHVVVDEEGGGWGTRSVIERGYKADGVIVCEPTWGDLYPAEGGLSWVRVAFDGASGHAGMRYAMIYPQSLAADDPFRAFGNGVNAIEKAVRFVEAVRELERAWALRKTHPLLPPGITTINPGVIVGGSGVGPDGNPVTTTNPAINPDRCIVEFDLKYLPTESFEDVRADFEAFVQAFAQTDPWLAEHPPTVEWHVRGVDFPPVNTPANHPLVVAMRESAASLNMSPDTKGFFAVTDAAFYAGAGMPAVIYGPSGGGFHGENEYVDVASLHSSAKTYAATLLRWCGV